MLTLVNGDDEMQLLLGSTNWHSAYIKEMHFAKSQFEIERIGGAATTICGETSLVRLLIVLPEDSHALEIVSFDTESCCFWPLHDLDESKTAIVQRRVTEADFGAFSLKCGCLAYQRLDTAVVGFGQYYGSVNLFDENGDLKFPYNIDWRAELDYR